MTKIAIATFCSLFALSTVIHADTPLEMSMKRTEKAYHQLTLDLKAPQDASKGDYVALAQTLKEESQKARDLVPKKVDTLPQDQQAAMTAAYQKSMDEMSATIDTLIQALQAGQWDDARKAMAKILDEEHAGHKEFRIHKGDKPGAVPAPASEIAPAPTTNAPAAAPMQ